MQDFDAQTSSFWEYVDCHLGPEPELLDEWRDSSHPEAQRAQEILLAQIPGAEKLLFLQDCDTDQAGDPLILELMINLVWQSDMAPSPCAGRRYDLSEFVVHQPEEFRSALLQKPPRGALTALWSLHEETTSFSYPTCQCERIVETVERLLIRKATRISCKENVVSAAILFLYKCRVEVYPFPFGWDGKLFRVREKLKVEDPEERALLDLPNELRGLVRCFGWRDINRALYQAKNEPCLEPWEDES